MDQRINIICAIRFTKLTDIIRYIDNHDGTATIETSQWQDIPMREGSGRMSVSGHRNGGSPAFRTDLSCRLKETIPSRCVGILSIDICGSGTYLLGTDDLPVAFETTTSLTSKTLQITYENSHFPLKTAI